MTSGFYTTRFVLAQDAAEAGTKALDVVLSDLSEFDVDTAGPPPELTVDEVREDARRYDEFAPGKGFTWF